MTQYAVRKDPNESSMWLKYRGGLCIEWTKWFPWETYGFDWIAHSDVHTYDDIADTAMPFREFNTSPLRIFLNTTKVSYDYKKSDLGMEYYDCTPATEFPAGDGKDYMGGSANESKEAWKMNNGLTLTGYLESDSWRDEQPFGAVGHGEGVEQLAFSLSQKLFSLQEMSKRGGVQGVDDPTSNGSRYSQPLTVSLNYGLNYWNYSNFKKYLMDVESYTYLEARKALAEKWMPGYRGNWNWSTNLTKDMLLNGVMTGGHPTMNAKLPAERVETIFTNCVMDDLRLSEDASNPNRMQFEIRLVFDTHWERWGADTTRTGSAKYLRFMDGTTATRGVIFNTYFPLLAPESEPGGESAPAAYIGPYAADWPE